MLSSADLRPRRPPVLLGEHSQPKLLWLPMRETLHHGTARRQQHPGLSPLEQLSGSGLQSPVSQREDDRGGEFLHPPRCDPTPAFRGEAVRSICSLNVLRRSCELRLRFSVISCTYRIIASPSWERPLRSSPPTLGAKTIR